MIFDDAEAPAVYAQLRSVLVPQLRALSATDALLAVPACPGWSVKDVVAHISGLVAETLAGVPLPRGSDEATARQVRDRAECSLAQVCDEWAENAAAFAAYGAQDPTYVAALTSDLVVHALDIGDVLPDHIDIGIEPVQLVASRYGALLQARARDAGCPVTLVLDGAVAQTLSRSSSSSSGAMSDAALMLRADSLGFLRAVTGRVAGSRVRAMNWTGDPESLLANAWGQYGPLKK